MNRLRHDLTVTSVETFAVPPRFLLVKVTTAGGVVGWGEAGVQTRRSSIATAVESLSALVVGADARDRGALWQLMRNTGFYGGGAVLSAAVAALDIALWDIAGRALDVPIHELLGGPVREVLPAYVWLGAHDSGDDPDVVAAEALALHSDGVRGFKLTAPHIPAVRGGAALDLLEAQFAAVRRAVGPESDVMVDCHGRVAAWQAREVISRLAPYRPLFIEEPLVPDNTREYAALCAWSPVSIAAGERAYDRREAFDLLQLGVRFLQPDVANAAGITEMQRIIATAGVTGAAVAPHCAIGPVALAASIQLGLASAEVVIQEDPQAPTERNVFQSYLVDPSVLEISGGGFRRLNGPGLGIEIDEAAVRSAAMPSSDPTPPILRHWDGSLAQW